jgi:hypothetical protein
MLFVLLGYIIVFGINSRYIGIDPLIILLLHYRDEEGYGSAKHIGVAGPSKLDMQGHVDGRRSGEGNTACDGVWTFFPGTRTFALSSEVHLLRF